MGLFLHEKLAPSCGQGRDSTSSHNPSVPTRTTSSGLTMHNYYGSKNMIESYDNLWFQFTHEFARSTQTHTHCSMLTSKQTDYKSINKSIEYLNYKLLHYMSPSVLTQYSYKHSALYKLTSSLWPNYTSTMCLNPLHPNHNNLPCTNCTIALPCNGVPFSFTVYGCYPSSFLFVCFSRY